MDLFSTNRLVAVMDDLRSTPPSNPTLTSVFFPTVIEETSEEIHFDTEDKPRRIAPFVSPLVQGKLIEEQGFATKTFKPAYIKQKRVFDAEAPLKRQIGEALTGNMTPEARTTAMIARALAEDLRMIRRRKEVMAGEALRLGQVTVAGDGYPTQVVGFDRNPAHTVDLSGGAVEWDDAGVSPVEDIEDWSAIVLQNSGAGVTDVVFTPTAWRLFRADANFEKAVDLRRGGNDQVDFSARVETGLIFMGTMGNRRLWTYYDWYVNEAGVEVPVLPDGTVILGSGAIEGVQAHGAIRDHRAGYQAMEAFPKSWVEEDPSAQIMMTQSAPLVVPFRANASFSANVT